MVAIIAIVVVVVVAAAILLIDKGDSDKKEISLVDDCRLVIYGNADNDDDLDQDDVKIIESIANGDMTWDKKAAPYADANNDGKVDSKDVDYVKAIIDKDSKNAPRIYYTDVNGKTSYVSQPVTKLGADYWPCMDGVVAIGATDILTHVDSGIYGQLSSNAVKYKGITQSDVVNFGSGFQAGYDFETIKATGVDAIVCGSAEIYFVDIESMFTDSTRIDMIRLPFWESDRVDSAVITLAYLLNNDKYIENAQKYLEYEDKITGILESGLAKVDKKASCLVVYIGSATESSLEVEIEARGCGSYECSELAGFDNLSADINKEGALNSSSMYYTTDQEYVIGKNPDYVLILGRSGFNRTAEDAQKSFDAGAAYLTTTKAYKNDNIWVSGSGNMSGLMQKVTALQLACMVYSDAFSGVDYNEYLQEFVDSFTLANNGVSSSSPSYFDVTKSGIWVYEPTH